MRSLYKVTTFLGLIINSYTNSDLLYIDWFFPYKNFISRVFSLIFRKQEVKKGDSCEHKNTCRPTFKILTHHHSQERTKRLKPFRKLPDLCRGSAYNIHVTSGTRYHNNQNSFRYPVLPANI